jgi:hypothetical protein
VVLGEAFGQEVGKAACRVLYKLGPLPHSTVVCRELLRAISVKPIAAALGHARALSSIVLSELPEFIDGTLPIALLHALPSPRGIPLVDACILLGHALGEEHRVGSILELATANTLETIGSWFDRWLLYLDFPTAPFGATTLLRPIANFSALRSHGNMMRQCIADYGEDIMAGAAADYSWFGAQEATLLLIRNSVDGWNINEIRGIDVTGAKVVAVRAVGSWRG